MNAVLLSVFAVLAAAFAMPAENLVRNPGFEEGPGPDSPAWSYNNWAGNDAEYALDETNPHGGRRCLRMRLRRANNGPNIQLIQRMRGLGPGDQLRISMWLRGPDNSRPLDVSFMHAEPPWNDWVRVLMRFGETWSRQTAIVQLPEQINPQKIAFMILLQQEIEVFIDDVEITRGPEESPDEPLPGNLLAGGSFETGKGLWTASLPWWPKPGRVQPQLCGAYDDWDLTTPDAPDAAEGRRVLRFDVGEPGEGIRPVNLYSPFFPVRFGHPHTVSLTVKGPPEGVIGIHLTHGEPGKEWRASHWAGTTGQPQRVSFTAKPTASNGGTCFLNLYTKSPGEWWIDDVCVTDDEARDRTRPLAVGVSPADESRVGHLYHRGDPVVARLLARGVPNGQLRLIGRTVDIDGEVVKTETIALSTDGVGVAEAHVQLPSERFGPRKLEVHPAGAHAAALPLAEFPYQILPRLTPPGEAPERFFGGHASTLGEKELRVLELVGVRSIRLHRPEVTKWCFVEPTEGQWDLQDAQEALRRAKSHGFDILGSFGYTPAWAADVPDGANLDGWLGAGPYPPRDWGKWREYVKRVVTATAGTIDTWELLNEPDLSEFMALSPAWSDRRVELYMKYLDETSVALREAGLPVRLVGVCSANPHDRFVDEVLARNPGDRLHATTFHYYGLNGLGLRDRIESTVLSAPVIGGGTEAWMTEGAYALHAQSWMRSARLPTAMPDLMGELAAGTVRQIITWKAMGVARHYQYPGPRPWNGGSRVHDPAWKFGADVFANPLPLWSAHAAAVRFLEGAKPAPAEALQVRPLSGRGQAVRCEFQRDDTRILVLWATESVALESAFADLPDGACYDLFANPIQRPHAIGKRPIYLLQGPVPPVPEGDRIGAKGEGSQLRLADREP